MLDGVTLLDNCTLPDFDRREILRYAGNKGEADETLSTLLEECLTECAAVFTPRLCYRVFDVGGFYKLFDKERQSKLLQTRLEGCDKVLIFAATVGIGIDRLIRKYAAVSPVKALVFQAIGAERIEALCDSFCEELKREYGCITGRFSAGYGDFPLSAQTAFFQTLDCARGIGLTLTDSLLMTPTKSVTAAVGLGGKQGKIGCAACEKKDCDYKK
ncbi:MAG: Vitamin B12 dependent methionine synthase activation subunit [Clostridia bacterium]|nr:Vitamin B12 dependent methionine synthase activation subunit [Clostridia bacterium]